VHLGYASELFGYHLRNHEPESDALGVHRPSVLQATEQLEQLDLVFFLDPNAVVEDTQDELV